MVTQARHPIWLPEVRAAGARTFATLYALESFARATVSSVVPIQAYEILRSEQGVSILYTVVALLGLSVTLFMPMLIRRLSRRWVYTAGACCLALGSMLFVFHTLPAQVGGMLLRVMGASALAITLSLYIMDHIRKADVLRTESVRMAWSMLAWTGGPTLGILLYTRFGILAPHLVVVAFAATLLAFFWYFRLSDNTAISPGVVRPANPLTNIRRFVAQPRLRLAWLIAFGRSCYWTTFFVYGPLLMVVTGQGELAGGILVSMGNALLFTAIWWGGVGRRIGVRNTTALAFAALSVALFLAAAAGTDFPLIAGAMLLVAAFFAVALDAVGSTPFIRAVHAYERPQMSAVYRTFLDLSELLPPLLYAAGLAFFGLGVTFGMLGVFMVICAAVAFRYLPKSM
jgi:predicted MFS family arabinose efflux permease